MSWSWSGAGSGAASGALGGSAFGPWGAAAGGLAGGLAGGFLGGNRSKDGWAPSSYNEAMRPIKRAVQWRVEDARKAGVHPLFALGFSGGQGVGGSVSRPVDPSIQFDASGAGRASPSGLRGDARRMALDESGARVRLSDAETALKKAQAAKLIQEMNYKRTFAPPDTPKPRERPYITMASGQRVFMPEPWSHGRAEEIEATYGGAAGEVFGLEALLRSKVPGGMFGLPGSVTVQQLLERGLVTMRDLKRNFE